MAMALVALAAALGVVGVTMLSEATLGVGVVALGCLCGILARIAQAAQQHKALMETLAPPES